MTLRRAGSLRNSARGEAPRGFRPDIQGLRAFAVLAVVAEHVTGWPSGGFVGVDIFFVISGFLITGILAREFANTGTISFSDFYRRRIKRIVPAATLTLVGTVIVGAFLLTRERAVSTLWDAVSAFFFVSNWRFAVTGTDYFAGGGLTSPVQQFWSLSVEEQYYFVWPWVMLGVLLLATGVMKRSRTQALRVALGVLVAIVVVSFCVAIYESATSATIAYFSSLSRAWELGVGGILALMAHRFTRIPPVLRTLLAWAGLCGMVVSVFVVSSSRLFPGPWAALPVVATAMAIVASTGAPARYNVVLVNPVARFFGDISYSLYLWHFPTLIFLAIIMPARGNDYIVIAFVSSLVLATAMYYAVERPLHKSPWLARFASPAARADAWHAWWRHDQRIMGMWGGVAVVTVLALTIAPHVYVSADTSAQRQRVAAAVADEADAEAAFRRLDPASITAGQTIAQRLREALHDSAWPLLDPPVDAVMSAGLVDLPGCDPSTPSDAATCSFGVSAGTELVVFGDSLGITLLPTVVGAFGDEYAIRGLTRSACPVIPLRVTYPDAATRDSCEDQQVESVRYINESKPAVVFVTENYVWATRLESGATGADLGAEWALAAASFATSIAVSGAAVVFVTPPSAGKQIVDCATPLSVPADCVSVIDGGWSVLRDAEASVPNAYLIDTMRWYCTAAGFCPAYANGTIIKRDYIHPTAQYAVSEEIVRDFRDMALALQIGMLSTPETAD